MAKVKQQSNPYSTGSGGAFFENNVQTAFAVLMLTDGFSPCLPNWPIIKIKFQAKHAGFETDDFVVYAHDTIGQKKAKLLIQVKRSITISEDNSTFEDVINAAWSDFNRSDFVIGVDAIALITGPLSTTDIENTRTLLEWAREMETAEEFINNVNTANFSNQQKRNKLQAFQTQLQKVKDDSSLSDEELWHFLRSFHLLGYDLDVKYGVHRSLLHSLIDQQTMGQSNVFWSLVSKEIQYANQNAGTLTKTDFPNEILSLLKESVEIRNPFVMSSEMHLPTSLNQAEFLTVLLIGQWDEANEHDRHIIELMSNESYNTWIVKIRELLDIANSPLKLKNNHWSVQNRFESLEQLNGSIYDEHIDRFQQCVKVVLNEIDPKFDLPLDERFSARIYGKTMLHSDLLRKDIVETLAFLSAKNSIFHRCSQFKIERALVLSVREILGTHDWKKWATLNPYLTLLAEASPESFLEAVEEGMVEASPFKQLFTQEGDGITGENYLTGLWWSLEGLSWEENHLAQSVLLLGELAAIDPGGKWGNRPLNSLMTIFLPWRPQTFASIEKKTIAIKALVKEIPEIGWKLLLSLLPNRHQITSGSYKLHWRYVAPEEFGKVTHTEYWEQVKIYSKLLVDMSNDSFSRKLELASQMDHLPEEAFDDFIEVLNSIILDELTHDEQYFLWQKLSELAKRHSFYANTEWAMSSDRIEKIECVSRKFAPTDPLIRYRELFNAKDHEMYSKESYEIQQKTLIQKRFEAIADIYNYGALEEVLAFSETVQSPFDVGWALASTVEMIDLNNLLNTTDKALVDTARGFVFGKFYKDGQEKVDSLDFSGWQQESIARFMTCLPFTMHTWLLVEKYLHESEVYYWKEARVNPWDTEQNIAYAIENLIKYSRFHEALFCLDFMIDHQSNLDKELAVNVVKSLLKSDNFAQLDTYYLTNVITKLQNNSEGIEDELFYIEWNFLPLLDGYHGATPKILQQRLANHPEFFSDVIQHIYRSTKLSEPLPESTEEQKLIAKNAYDLLSKWKHVPGVQKDGTFNPSKFLEWINEVKRITEESGHLDIAMTKIGYVLIYAPEDSSGLWIDKVIADVLNAKDAKEMREGFILGFHNDRGVHWIDPTGAPERDLAEQYLSKANDIEKEGFVRLASSLKELSQDYVCEMERVIEQYTRGEEE